MSITAQLGTPSSYPGNIALGTSPTQQSGGRGPDGNASAPIVTSAANGSASVATAQSAVPNAGSESPAPSAAGTTTTPTVTID